MRAHDDQVLVEGISPGSQVVVMGVIRVVVGTIPGFQRWIDAPTDLDGDGSETITLDAEVRPNRSVWVAVDLTSMAWAMSQPVVGGSPLAIPAETTLVAGSTQWPVPAGKIEVLAVRPGDGIVAAPEIWAASVWDGGPNDGDGIHNGSVGVKAQKLVFLDSSLSPSPPEAFEAGDLLVAFHPETFHPFVARVTEGGGQ